MTPDMDTSPIILDLETAGLPNAAEFLEPIPDAAIDTSPIEANRQLVDPEKIAASIAQKRAAQAERNAEAVARVEQQRQARLEKTALDWNVGRIVAIGWWTQTHTHCSVLQTEDMERTALGMFWREAKHRTIVGFAIKGFDLRFLVQRSRYLGVPYPALDFSKYSRRGITDLFLDLTFGDGTYDQGAMRRTLSAFCRRFGIPLTDTVTGKDIPALVAAGDWAAVEAHVRADVEATVALARRLGVLQPQPEPAAVA